jgi:molybdenum ABC transporter molybdate-binding protein
LRRSSSNGQNKPPASRRKPCHHIAPLLFTIAFLTPCIAQARDLVVYGEPTLEKVLKSTGALWQVRTGTRVNVFVAPSDLSYAQIDRGARCDVIFAAAGRSTNEALLRKTIDGGTMRRVFHNDLILIGTEAEEAPSASLHDFSRLLAGKKFAIANPNRDPGGAQAAALLAKIGIVVDYSSKDVMVAESSAAVMSLLATGKIRLGIVYATDAAGMRLRVPLPASDYTPIEYVVATAKDAVSPVGSFITFVKSAEASAVFRSAGLRTIDD